MNTSTARIERRKDETLAISYLHLVPDMTPSVRYVPGSHRTRAMNPAARQQRGHDQLLLAALVMMLALLVSSWACDQVRARTTSAVLDVVPTVHHTVVAGESLWSIAVAHPVEGVSTQDIVRWLGETNDLDSSVLALGQTLVVPRQEPVADPFA